MQLTGPMTGQKDRESKPLICCYVLCLFICFSDKLSPELKQKEFVIHTGSRVNLKNLVKKGEFKKVRKTWKSQRAFLKYAYGEGKSQGVFCMLQCFSLASG